MCEVAQQERLAALFGARDVGHGEVELAPGLFSVSVQPERAMHEWLRHQLKSGALAGLLGRQPAVRLPDRGRAGRDRAGHDGQGLGPRAARAAHRRVGLRHSSIMDAPATGHGLALLRAPRTYANIARVGPIARQAASIDAFLRDAAATGVLGGRAARGDAGERDARPRAAAGRASSASRSTRWWSTACCPSASQRGARRLRRAGRAGLEAGQAAPCARRSPSTRARRGQREQLERLRAEVRAPVTSCRTCSSPSLGRRELELLSDRLEEAL